MKIDEFIKKVRKYAYVREDNGRVFICDIFFTGEDNFDFHNRWFLSLQTDEVNLKANYDWGCLEDVNINDLRIILSLVKELQDTPAKDRFPEKEYYLVANRELKQYGTNAMKYVNCIYNGSNEFSLEYGEPAKFSERELGNIKKLCPFIAPAIDAMKEPVEEK